MTARTSASHAHPVVAIDGPAAAGKGTLARRLATEMKLPYLDTGLLYRAVGRRVLDAGADPNDASAAEAAARTLHPADLQRSDLRGPPADAAASAVAAIPAVRAALLHFQQSFAASQGAVLDGRDIGTVIFPAAQAKLFITASIAERARRRWLELQGKGDDTPLSVIQDEMVRRDERDAARDAAPLRAAPDAFVIDTSGLDAEAVFRTALGYVRQRLAQLHAS